MTEFYMLIDGVPGNACDPRAMGWLQLTALEWRASSAGPGGGGHGAGRVAFDRLRVVFPSGRAGQQLYIKWNRAEHIRHADVRGFGGKGLTMTAKLRDILVDSCKFDLGSSDVGGPPLTEVVFGFDKLEFVYGTL